MAVSGGKETNFPWSAANDHDDPWIWVQKINFPIFSSANSLWPELVVRKQTFCAI